MAREKIDAQRKFKRRSCRCTPEVEKHLAKAVGRKPSQVEAYIDEDGVVTDPEGNKRHFHVVRIYSDPE